MTGYRLGYVVSPNSERAELLLRVQEATLVAPNTPVQYAGLAAISDGASHLQHHHEYVRKTRDSVLSRLSEKKLLWTIPKGGWYAMLDLSAYTEDTDDFCTELLNEAGVALAPGRSFAPEYHEKAKGLARIAFCREYDYTMAGVDSLINYLSK